METKICTKCHEEKPIDDFTKRKMSKDGHYNQCKKCDKEYHKIYFKNNKEKITIKCEIYYQNNKEKINEKKNIWVENNKDNIKERQKLYRKNNKEKVYNDNKKWTKNNKGKIIEYGKRYYENNKELLKEKHKIYRESHKLIINKKILNYKKIKRQNDVFYKLKDNVRNLITKSIKRKEYTKKSRSYEILGCPYDTFKLHLESQFKDWMSWDNYGLYNGELNHGWDIDHIIPLKTATTEEDVIRLNHYTNLQPLCSYINRVIKKSKLNFDGV